MRNESIESSNVQNPVSDLLYDWITILHSKAEGVQAYEKYMRDADEENSDECRRLLEDLRMRDIEMLEEIKDHVAQMMTMEMSDESMELGRSDMDESDNDSEESEFRTHQ